MQPEPTRFGLVGSAGSGRIAIFCPALPPSTNEMNFAMIDMIREGLRYITDITVRIQFLGKVYRGLQDRPAYMTYLLI